MQSWNPCQKIISFTCLTPVYACVLQEEKKEETEEQLELSVLVSTLPAETGLSTVSGEATLAMSGIKP